MRPSDIPITARVSTRWLSSKLKSNVYANLYRGSSARLEGGTLALDGAENARI